MKEKKYLFEYYHAGSTWAFDLYANDEDDALQKFKSLKQTGIYVGECAFEIKINKTNPVVGFINRIFGNKQNDGKGV